MLIADITRCSNTAMARCINALNVSDNPNTKWIIDLDEKNLKIATDLVRYIKDIEPIGDKLYHVLPTRNGFHLITKPFNLQVFKTQYPELEIHKNNPTILYVS